MRIEILCTGDEVLTGKITNTNFSYMSQKLEDAGLSVYWGTTVGDDRAHRPHCRGRARGSVRRQRHSGGPAAPVDSGHRPRREARCVAPQKPA